MPASRVRPGSVFAAAALAVLLLAPGAALAECDVIKSATTTFRSALGSTDRTTAPPGDRVEIAVQPEVCDTASPGLGTPGACLAPADLNVTVLFTPPAGPSSAVVLSTDCAALTARLAALDASLSGTAICQDASSSEVLDVVEREVSPGVEACRALFAFPDTDALAGAPDDDLTASGSAKIVLTAATADLPVGLAGGRCATYSQTGLLACVDEFYAVDGTCRTERANVDPLFPNFVALPVVNDYQALCNDGPTGPCADDPSPPALRFTIDDDGNAIVPWVWTGVLSDIDQGDFPIPRLVSGETLLPAFEGSSAPVRLPGPTDVQSFSPRSHPLPPIFDAQVAPPDPGAPEPPAALFGSVDAPRGFFRVARFSTTFRECRDGTGTPTGVACAEDAECGAGNTCGPALCRDAAGAPTTQECSSVAECASRACGPALFDFAGRFSGEACGPVLIPPTDYSLTAKRRVPLEGLLQTAELNLFTEDESVDANDLNDDGDVRDDSLTADDRDTGEELPFAFGEPGGEDPRGRAVARVSLVPFRFPAVSGEGECVAFLESEPAEAFVDWNANAHVGDTNLRVFCRDGDAMVALGPESPATPADAAPVINDQAVLLSDGLVFFRTPEAAVASQVGRVVSPGTEPSLSADARRLAFVDGGEVWVHDRDADGNGVFDEAGGTTTTRVSVPPPEFVSNGPSGAPVVSDNPAVAFHTFATNLVQSGPANATVAVLVRDLGLGVTENASVDDAGTAADGICLEPSVSADGNLVAYQCLAANLDPPDANFDWDVFVHDRTADTTRLVSVDSGGAQCVGGNRAPALSPDGTHVAFVSECALAADDTNGVPDVYLHSLATGETRRVSISSVDEDGGFVQANFASLAPSVCNGGEAVAFQSDATNLVAGDTNGRTDVYVHFVDRGVTERVSVAPDGTEGDGASTEPAISADCRFVAFRTAAESLTDDPPDGRADVVVADLASGILAQRSGAAGGFVPVGGSLRPSLSGDGRTAVFDADVSVPSLEFEGLAAAIHGPDTGDPGADLDGNGRVGEVVLQVLDTTAPAPAPVVLGEASRVAVSGRNAAFLGAGNEVFLYRPSCGGAVGGAVCATDADCGAGACLPVLEALGRPAVDVAISDTAVCALVSEALEGGDLNGDTDLDDAVVACHTIGDPPSASLDEVLDGAGVAQAADAIGVADGTCVFVQPEAGQGADGNGDADTGDRVLRLCDTATGLTVGLQDTDGNPVPAPAAEEFVISPGAAAVGLRTCEADEGGQALNGDGDALDCVLQGVRVASRELLGSGQAVIPCNSQACKPRKPYQVQENETIRFLTRESDQGADLNGDGDQLDTLVQRFSLVAAQTTTLAQVDPATLDTTNPLGSGASGSLGLGDRIVVSSNRCVEPVSGAVGEPCTSDIECPAGWLCQAGFLVSAASEDGDGDGVEDLLDNCPATPNPSQADFDGDGAGDACDGFSCGDGVVQAAESCDEGVALNGTEASACLATCTPAVRIDIKPGNPNNPINGSNNGVEPVAILGSIYLNLDTTPIPGLIPEAEAVDVTTLLFRASEPDEPCEPEGATPKHDLLDPVVYANHLEDVNGDAIPDLVVHFPTPDIDIEYETEEGCLTGRLSGVTGLSGVTFFEDRDVIQPVWWKPLCGLGFEIVLVLPPLMAVRRAVRRRRVPGSA